MLETCIFTIIIFSQRPFYYYNLLVSVSYLSQPRTCSLCLLYYYYSFLDHALEHFFLTSGYDDKASSKGIVYTFHRGINFCLSLLPPLKIQTTVFVFPHKRVSRVLLSQGDYDLSQMNNNHHGSIFSQI